MKRLVILVTVLMMFGMSAGLAVADMDGSRVPPKATEGPDIRAKVEPKGVEGPDVRRAFSPLVPNGDGIVAR